MLLAPEPHLLFLNRKRVDVICIAAQTAFGNHSLEELIMKKRTNEKSNSLHRPNRHFGIYR